MGKLDAYLRRLGGSPARTASSPKPIAETLNVDAATILGVRWASPWPRVSITAPLPVDDIVEGVIRISDKIAEPDEAGARMVLIGSTTSETFVRQAG